MNIRSKFTSKGFRMFGVITGALIASIGLELFLIPHGIMVGGITGLSALFALYTEISLGLFLLLLNLPVVWLQRKWNKPSYLKFATLGLLVLSAASLALHPFPSLISNPIAAALAGGLAFGFGIGIAIRFGGPIDMVEKVAELIRLKLPISTEAIIVTLNCILIIIASKLLGSEQILYTVVAYMLTYIAIKISLQGLRFNRHVVVTSAYGVQIQEALLQQLNRKAENNYGQLHFTCHLWEVARMTSIVKAHDPHSVIQIDYDEHNEKQ